VAGLASRILPEHYPSLFANNINNPAHVPSGTAFLRILSQMRPLQLTPLSLATMVVISPPGNIIIIPSLNLDFARTIACFWISTPNSSVALAALSVASNRPANANSQFTAFELYFFSCPFFYRETLPPPGTSPWTRSIEPHAYVRNPSNAAAVVQPRRPPFSRQADIDAHNYRRQCFLISPNYRYGGSKACTMASPLHWSPDWKRRTENIVLEWSRKSR